MMHCPFFLEKFIWHLFAVGYLAWRRKKSRTIFCGQVYRLTKYAN